MISQPIYTPPISSQGTLRIYPQKAHIHPSSITIFSGAKLFCKVRLGMGVQETLPDLKNGHNPVWAQEIAFKRNNEESIKIELCHKNLLFSVDIIGETVISLQKILSEKKVTMTETLYHFKKGAIGTIQLTAKWEPDNIPSQSFFQTGAPFSVNASLAQAHFPAPTNANNAPQRILVPQNMLQQGGRIMVPIQNPNPSVPYQQNQGFVVGNPGYQPQYSNYQTGYNYNTQNANLRPGTAQQPYMQNTPYPQNMDIRPGTSQQIYGQSGYQGMPNQAQQPIYGQAGYQGMPNQAMGGNANVELAPKKEEDIKDYEEEIVDADFPEEQRCIICMEKRKSGAFYKCGHNCCCMGCGKKFLGKDCPICREKVLDIIKVFHT